MTEVWFYHLERQPLDAVLPRISAGLLQRGERLCIRLPNAERVESISHVLWGHEDTSFIAHGCDGDTPNAFHSVWITSKSHDPLGAEIQIFAEGVLPESLAGYRRAMIFLSAADESALAIARALWQRLKAEGVPVRYWRQSDSGRWEDHAAAKAA
jgi:DNA polymerase-3 subunit chi